MKKTVWTFGLIAGGILAAMMLLTAPFEAQIGYDRAEVIGYTTMVAAFLLIFFGIRSYRDNVVGGDVRFWRAFGVGLGIAAIAAVCYTATWEALYYWIRPDYPAKMAAQYEAHVRSSGGSPEQVAKQLADAKQFMENYNKPMVNVAYTFIEPLPVGLVIALVSAGVLSRRRRVAGAQLA